MIEQIMTQKILDAIPTETKFEIGDKVRCVTNKHLFEKGALPKWSNKVYVIMNTKAHSYLLDNETRPRSGRAHECRWFKYYQIQKVEIRNEEATQRQEEYEQMKRERTIQRKLRQEGIEKK